jgi:hypothetical protein
MAVDVDLYLQQWLKTATDDVVTYSHASAQTDRLVFHCMRCLATAECDRPKDSNTIDYYIREFVNLHAHKGGHARLIDNSPTKQKAILAQMEKYKTEIELLKIQKQKQDEQKEVKAYPGKVIDIQTGLVDNQILTKTWVSNATGGGDNLGIGGSWRTNPHTGATEWVSPVGGHVKWFPVAGSPNPNPNNLIPFPQPVPYVPVPPPPTPPAPKEKALKPKTGRRFR